MTVAGGDGGRNLYRFRSEWTIDAPVSAVFSVLERFEEYPTWWPEVRTLRLVAPESCEVTCRSVLPYDLTFVLSPARRDRAAGVLEATMTGDLDGYARWTVGAGPRGSHLVFEEEVIANKRLLRVLAPFARPVFRGNHTVMMRHARVGLLSRLQDHPLIEEMAVVTT